MAYSWAQICLKIFTSFHFHDVPRNLKQSGAGECSFYLIFPINFSKYRNISLKPCNCCMFNNKNEKFTCIYMNIISKYEKIVCKYINFRAFCKTGWLLIDWSEISILYSIYLYIFLSISKMAYSWAGGDPSSAAVYSRQDVEPGKYGQVTHYTLIYINSLIRSLVYRFIERFTQKACIALLIKAGLRIRIRIRIRIRSDPECFARIRIRNNHSGSGSDQYEN